jgi:hypothetical protein
MLLRNKTTAPADPAVDGIVDGIVDDPALSDFPPERGETSWQLWRVVVPVAVAAAVAAWFAQRGLRLPAYIAQFHDDKILWVVLKGIYAPPGILAACAALAAVVLLLYPHGRVWPVATILVAALAAGWIVSYEMWRNAPWASVFVMGVSAYVLARYAWKLIVRIPLFGRIPFAFLEAYVSSNPRAEGYYDAIMGTSTRADGSAPAVDDRALWQRAKADSPAGRWARWFAKAAQPYRQDAHPAWLGWVRLLNGHRVPASLRNHWLRQILLRREEQARANFRKDQCSPDGGQWKQAMDLLITACEARAEYLAFDPASHPEESERLLEVAALYDHLARLTLIRQMWLANTEPPEPAPGDAAGMNQFTVALGKIDDEWKALRAQRRTLLGRAAKFRALYLGLPADGDAAAELKVLGELSRKNAKVGGKAVQLLVLAISRIQETQFAGKGWAPADAEMAEQLSSQLGEALECAGRARARDRAMAARKALELAIDCRSPRWAQIVLWMQLLSERAPGREEDYDDAAFEGHIYWFLARTIDADELRLVLYRQAAEAFRIARRPQEFNALRDEVRRLAR